MNGNVTKEGITLDLEAKKRVGIGGVQNFDAGTGIPKGPIVYLDKAGNLTWKAPCGNWTLGGCMSEVPFSWPLSHRTGLINQEGG